MLPVPVPVPVPVCAVVVTRRLGVRVRVCRYVKLYLSKENKDVKGTKQKTATIKKNNNPIYEQRFVYYLQKKTKIDNAHRVQITCWNDKPGRMTSNECMGGFSFTLEELASQHRTGWYVGRCPCSLYGGAQLPAMNHRLARAAAFAVATVLSRGIAVALRVHVGAGRYALMPEVDGRVDNEFLTDSDFIDPTLIPGAPAARWPDPCLPSTLQRPGPGLSLSLSLSHVRSLSLTLSSSPHPIAFRSLTHTHSIHARWWWQDRHKLCTHAKACARACACGCSANGFVRGTVAAVRQEEEGEGKEGEERQER